MRTIISNYKYLLSIVMVLFPGSWLLAQDAATGTAKPSNQTFLLIIIGLLLFILLVMSVILRQMGNVVRDAKRSPGYVKKESGLKAWWNDLDKKFFTKAVPVEKEADVLLDHDYDGIKELDNALPPWWKWGFYFTLVVGVIYLLRFHVWKTGPDPIQEYQNELAYAAKKAEAYRAASSAAGNEQVDETTVTLADAAGVAEGKKIFMQTCSVCHGSNGEGGVGPNLTDQYWLHGGTINDVFKTIKYGVPEKGMQSWQKAYSPTQLKDLSSYIKSIGGTNPANAKAPQGNLFTEAATADSTGAAKADSASASPN
jgi:cytochrome c oxidase cbb3-type subunit 3